MAFTFVFFFFFETPDFEGDSVCAFVFKPGWEACLRFEVVGECVLFFGCIAYGLTFFFFSMCLFRGFFDSTAGDLGCAFFLLITQLAHTQSPFGTLSKP